MSKERKNATLKWVGRKLMCNGISVAELVGWSWAAPEGRGRMYVRLGSDPELFSRASETAARRAINRKFNLPPESGSE